jgi:hypothetical protein
MPSFASCSTVALDTAIADSFPFLTCCCAPATAVNTSGICPPSASVIACPPPL